MEYAGSCMELYHNRTCYAVHVSVARPNCSICSDPTLRDRIAEYLAAGRSFEAISRAEKEAGRALKAETVSAHFRGCMDSKRPSLTLDALEQVVSPGRDFALLVRDKAVEALQDGDIRITAQHGLTAQGLLDRRAEKQADREFGLNLARLLSGAVVPTPMTVIEGRAVTIESGEEALLAPVGVYDDASTS